MAIQFKEKSIKYVNKDFQGIKKDLIEFTKAHHSGAFQDFNETSPGMALLELVAYVGDVLSFYQDMQFEELKQDTARQIENVTSFAKRLGYRPSGKRTSRGILSVFFEVPAILQGGQIVPDSLYCPILRAGSRFQSLNGTLFESLADIDFSKETATESTTSPRLSVASQTDETTGLPTHFAVRKDVEVVAGETIEESHDIGSFQQFLNVELQREDAIEILSVTDSDGNDWFEVDYLAQEVIFDAGTNQDSDNTIVPYTLKLKPAPRRFIVDRDPITNRTSLIFGSGDGVNFDDELVPNIANYAIPSNSRSTFSNFSIDPQNFLKTRTLGMSPYNTTLTVRYRVGGGSETNVPEGSIQDAQNITVVFSSTGLDETKRANVESSIECINVSKTQGGAPEETIAEIKANSSAYFAAQNRTVTKEDYIARLFSLPQKFGKVEKAFIRRDATNELALDIHVLTKNELNQLSKATPTLRQNIKKYLSQSRILTESVNILDTEILNIKINFGVVISSKFNRSEVLTKCLNAIKNKMTVDNMQIGQPIIVSDLISELQSIVGVISVYDMQIRKALQDGSALTYVDQNNMEMGMFDVQAHTVNGIVYCPENAIFQIKYPDIDITGESR